MADANRMSARLKPANYISDEVIQIQGEVVNKRKKHALMDTHEIIPNDGWKKQFELWSNATEEERKDIIYGMVMHDGAIKPADISRFFGIDKKELTQFKLIYDAAIAALKLKIQRNQISIALQREDQSDMKFFLGKQFAEQVQNPAHEGVASVDTAPPSIVINEVKADNTGLRNELEAAVQTAMAIAKVK